MNFPGLLGNDDLKARLSAAFALGRTSHCYLLSGPRGSGKKTLARILSAALQCEAANRPCGYCNACRKAFSGQHPDIITVDDPAKKTVYVQLIRDLQADAYIRPNEGKYKIYVIPRAQDMNENAQNALLKLIEEPPSYGVFLLLTDNDDQLLPTVRSRCASLRLEPVPAAEALPWLSQQCPGKTSQEYRAAYGRSGGYLGQALELLRGELTLPQTEEFANVFARSDGFGLTALLCAMEKQPRDGLLAILTQWKQLLTDALLVRAGLHGSPLAETLGRSRTAPELVSAAEVIQQAMEYCEANIGAGHLCGWLIASLRSKASL